jgi:hypothetical protein
MDRVAIRDKRKELRMRIRYLTQQANIAKFFIYSLVAGSTTLSSMVYAAADAWYLVKGPCSSSELGLSVEKLNAPEALETCLDSVQASSRADVATQDALQRVDDAAATAVVRVEADIREPALVSEVYETIAGPIVPLQVDRLRYYQASAAACDPKAVVSFRAVHDSGLFGLKVQRGRGERDIRVNTIYELPTEWTLERVRHEILYERALFRGIVERPTFDILRPNAERPLLVTVFDVLPRVRSEDACPALKPNL